MEALFARAVRNDSSSRVTTLTTVTSLLITRSRGDGPLIVGSRFVTDTMSNGRIAICDGLLRFANRLRQIPTRSEC